MSRKLTKVAPGNLLASFFRNRDNDFFSDFFEEGGVMPAVNVTENNDAFTLELSVPGFTKEDVTIECSGHMLTISAKKENKNEETDKKGKILRREFSSSSFSRSFTLGEDVDADNISAQCRDGVLSVVLPKTHKAVEDKAKRIEIS